MRKNIFSWKSLAGLTLLFGLTMGLSSCEQVELTPDDSTNSGETTTEPSVGVDGSDIVITATTIKQINDSLQTKKVADVIAAKDEVTITIESAALEVTADSEITIPSNLDDKTLNFEFTNTFKKAEGLLTINGGENIDYELNIILPDGDFGKLKVVDSYGIAASVASAGTTDVEISSDVKGKLALGNGLNVTATMGDITRTYLNGATIVAAVTGEDCSARTSSGSGVLTPIKGKSDLSGDQYTKVLIIRGENVSVSGGTSNTTDFTKVTVEAGASVAFSGNVAASEVVGLLKDGKLAASMTGLSNKIAKASNIKISDASTSSAAVEIGTTKFTNCEFDKGPNYEYTKDVNSAEGVEFSNASEIKVNVWPASVKETSYTFTFKDVNFNTGAKFNVADYKVFEEDEWGEVMATWYLWKDYDASVSDTVTVAYDKATAENIKKVLDENPYNAEEVHYAYIKPGSSKSLNYYVIVTNYKAFKGEDGKDSVYVSFKGYGAAADLSKSRTYNDIPAGLRRLESKTSGSNEATGEGETLAIPEGHYYAKVTDNVEAGMEYEGFTVIFAFDNCKYNGKALTKDIEVTPEEDMKKATGVTTMNFRYSIGGKLYKVVKGNKSGISWLEEVDE